MDLDQSDGSDSVQSPVLTTKEIFCIGVSKKKKEVFSVFLLFFFLDSFNFGAFIPLLQMKTSSIAMKGNSAYVMIILLSYKLMLCLVLTANI